MHFSAVIRCLPLDPSYAVDIGVLRHGDPGTLGLVLADICSGIVSGPGGLNIVRRQNGEQLRYTDPHGMSALIQGVMLSALETLLEYDIHFSGDVTDTTHPRANPFVLRVADEIQPSADFLYTVELKQFPTGFHGEKAGVLRPWITLHHTEGFAGWSDDVLMTITAARPEIS